jgi:hypothetical protein
MRMRRGLLGGSEAEQRIGHDDDAPAALERVDIDDAAGQGDRPDAALQHRRAPLPARLLHDREAGAAKSQGDRGVAPYRPAPQQDNGKNRDDRRGQAKPARRLDGRGEEQCDAGAEENRQPQDAAIAFGGESLGQRGERPPAPARWRAEPFAPAGKIRRKLCHGYRTSRVTRAWSAVS